MRSQAKDALHRPCSRAQLLISGSYFPPPASSRSTLRTES